MISRLSKVFSFLDRPSSNLSLYYQPCVFLTKKTGTKKPPSVKKVKVADTSTSTKPTTAKLPTLVPLGSSSKVIPTTSKNTFDKTRLSPIKSVKSPTREKSPPKNLKFSPSKIQFPSTGSKTTSYLTEYEERKIENFSFSKFINLWVVI